MSQILTVKANIKIPTVPNFLLSDGDMHFPLSAFDDVALRQIGEKWIENLLERAAEQRSQLPRMGNGAARMTAEAKA